MSGIRRAPAEELGVGVRGGRAVGRLGDQAGLDPRRVPARDLVLEGGRDEDVAVDLEDIGIRDVGHAREALHGAVLALPGDDLGDVEAARVVDATRRVGDRDDARPLLGDQPGRDKRLECSRFNVAVKPPVSCAGSLGGAVQF